MPTTPHRPAFAHKRPAPRRAGGWGKPITDDITWTRILQPRERYRITYEKDSGDRSERDIELQMIGHTTLGTEQIPYLGVTEGGRFKTLRTDRVITVLQVSEGHLPSIIAAPGYGTLLPPFPLEPAVFRVPTTAVSKRCWTVDLNAYTCTCPEKRERGAKGYRPGQLGFTCDHIAKAILAHLPASADPATWSTDLLKFLRDPRKVHIDNLN